MQFLHGEGALPYSDKHGWSHWDESFDVRQSGFEGLHPAAYFLQGFQRRKLAALQQARRKHGEVGCQMRQSGMQLLPQPLDELPNRTPNVSHQGVTGILHDRSLAL
jgi:hypothetical protein